MCSQLHRSIICTATAIVDVSRFSSMDRWLKTTAIVRSFYRRIRDSSTWNITANDSQIAKEHFPETSSSYTFTKAATTPIPNTSSPFRNSVISFLASEPLYSPSGIVDSNAAVFKQKTSSQCGHIFLDVDFHSQKRQIPSPKPMSTDSHQFSLSMEDVQKSLHAL